jgi:hypothetical protein
MQGDAHGTKGPTSQPGVRCCFQSSQCWTFTWTTYSGFIDHNLLQNWWPAFLCRSILHHIQSTQLDRSFHQQGLRNPYLHLPVQKYFPRWQQTLTCTIWRLSSSGAFLIFSNTSQHHVFEGRPKTQQGLRLRSITQGLLPS